jgi:hypothetical protein
MNLDSGIMKCPLNKHKQQSTKTQYNSIIEVYVFIVVANVLLDEELISLLFLESNNYIFDLFCNNNFFEPFDDNENVVVYVTNIEMHSNFIGIEISVFIVENFDLDNVWFMNISVSQHMTIKKHWFKNLQLVARV